MAAAEPEDACRLQDTEVLGNGVPRSVPSGSPLSRQEQLPAGLAEERGKPETSATIPAEDASAYVPPKVHFRRLNPSSCLALTLKQNKEPQ